MGFPGLKFRTNTEGQKNCLAQGHNTVTPSAMRLKTNNPLIPSLYTLQTEPLSLCCIILKRSTGLCSTVGNMSGNRCELDCRSRGLEFDSGPVPYFPGNWSWNNFYSHSPPFLWIIQEGLLSVTSESICTKFSIWLTACLSLARKKCGKVNWASRHDHSCWLGT